MAKKALSINFPIERVVLSDVLPYEVPIVFSNRHFYGFLCDHSVHFSENKIVWNKKDTALDSLVKLLMGVKSNIAVKHSLQNGVWVSTIDLQRKDLPAIPFTFSTTHKQDQLRQLSLMHPRSQIMVVDFYNKFKDLLIYYSCRSEFTLRAPRRVAGCTYIDYKAQIELNDKSNALVEEEGENYENLRSFFVYERFSNVFKFYESPEHLDCEREFQHLTKLDVSACFDSVYTHSIAWAIYGKDFAKTKIAPILKAFPGRFDSLMQQLNYNETNGILIGPEVSRIFTEIILQAVDVEVCNNLRNRGLKHKEDFRVYRYVDDFFVFHNNAETCHQIKIALQESLKTYKLSLNKGKEETLSRPIITSISIAKKRISDLLENALSYDISSEKKGGEDLPRGEIRVRKSSLITDFKSILATSNIGYSDILNYSLSVVERRIRLLIEGYKKLQNHEGMEKSFTYSMKVILDFVFFIYAVSPKVNTTIKLCRICQRILSFYQHEKIGLGYGASISQTIYERCRSVMAIHADGGGSKIEVMYVLVLMRQLGKNYRIDESSLAKCFGFDLDSENYCRRDTLDYFSIITLYFYIEKKSRYSTLRDALDDHVIKKFKLKKDSLVADSEMTHLALDLIACPYVARKLQVQLLKLLGIPESSLKRIQEYNEYWFTKWGDFDLSKELDAKVSQEVY